MDAPIVDSWFGKIPPKLLCRLGGNGPDHPSQLYALKRYAEPYMTIVDIGCGSGTTIEALLKVQLPLAYIGIDSNPINIEYCKKQFPDFTFLVEDATKTDLADQSFDISYSRHVFEHLPSFESGLQEQLRLAKTYAIIILWAPFVNGEQDEIKHIEEAGKVWTSEYSNRYSRSKILETLKSQKDWKLLEFTEGIGKEVHGSDTVIVLERKRVIK